MHEFILLYVLVKDNMYPAGFWFMFFFCQVGVDASGWFGRVAIAQDGHVWLQQHVVPFSNVCCGSEFGLQAILWLRDIACA